LMLSDEIFMETVSFSKIHFRVLKCPKKSPRQKGNGLINQHKPAFSTFV
jgi:hypothetical protein